MLRQEEGDMEVRALCFRLLINVLMLLVTHVQQGYPQTSDADFHMVPSRLQLFQYESVSFTCQGFNDPAGWRVRNVNDITPKCLNGAAPSTVTCTIDYAFKSDSGGYWCEGGGGRRSNSVNITVSEGHVVLESPVLPVMEGAAVTLRCRSRNPSSNLTADFYKDSLLVGTSPTGNMTIQNVSKSDDGFYKCKISGAGESAESQLMIRAVAPNPTVGSVVSGAGESAESRHTVKVRIPKTDGSVKQSENSNTQHTDRKAPRRGVFFPHPYYILLWAIISVVLFLQLLVIGLLYWKKQLVLLQVKLSDPNKDMYTVVKKDKKKKRKKDAADAADNLSICLETNHSRDPQTEKDQDE
ncbi:low affinity immunoglobulin gamma Fc region receptor II-a, partial [Lates calcarifer]